MTGLLKSGVSSDGSAKWEARVGKLGSLMSVGEMDLKLPDWKRLTEDPDHNHHWLLRCWQERGPSCFYLWWAGTCGGLFRCGKDNLAELHP